jgi:dolichol-phosphate mannosyltransferase
VIVRLSIITPAFNESQNLFPLYERLARAMSGMGVDWEWLVVDDHSKDDTFALVEKLAVRDPRVRGIRLARNSGSHVAIRCGLHHVDGDAAAMIASDLQDPPETLRLMVERWRGGAKVVWAVRRERPGKRTHARFAAIYYWIMRRLVGMKEMPKHGADFFLIDRVVIDAFRSFPERNTSVLALITWLGFEQHQVEYDKQPRASGRSGWTLARKIKLVIDSVTSFSDFPIRFCSYAGMTLIAVAAIALILSIVLLPSLAGGILFLLAVFLGIGGLQLVALGIVGEYVWRALDEARRRPGYVIEAVVPAVHRPVVAPPG